MAGLVALVVFTLVLVTVTLVVVRARAREAAAKTRPPGEVEQYRRLPLVPEGGLVCCDTQASSTKSCSCYSRSGAGASHCHYIASLSSIRLYLLDWYIYSLFRYQGLAMNTFGKSCDKADPGYMCPRSGDSNISTLELCCLMLYR